LSTLNFDKGVNVIIGDSDSGKSAIIRTIKKIFYNKPGGDDFRSWWGGDTNLMINIDDNQEVRRDITNSENLYYLNDTRFAAFGSDIPEEVKQALNINETNLQNQLDAPFLLSKTPGEAAIFLNKIAHIDKIHTTTSLINSWIKELNADIKADNNSIKQKREALELLPDLIKLEIDIEVIEEAQNRRQNLIQSRTKLVSLLNQRSIIVDKINDLAKLIALKDPIEEILIIYFEKEEKDPYRANLANTLDSIKGIKKKLKSIRKLIELKIPLENVFNLIDQKTEKQDKYNALQKVVNSITNLQESIKSNHKLVIRLQNELKEETPDICPFCGTNLKK
jgi:hypothetical protein